MMAQVFRVDQLRHKYQSWFLRSNLEVLPVRAKSSANHFPAGAPFSNLEGIVSHHCKIMHFAGRPVMVRNILQDTASATRGRARLFYVKSGQCAILARNRQNIVGPGSVFVTVEDEPYGLSYNKPHEVSTVEISIDRLKVSERVLRSIAFSAVENAAQAGFLFAAALEKLFSAEPMDAYGLDCYTAGLVELVLRTSLSQRQVSRETHSVSRGQIESYVKKNATNPELRAQSIAMAMGVSTRSLYKIFEGGDESLSGLIQRERVWLARVIIENNGSQLTLDQIARDTGFGSSHTFVRAFQRVIGCTPTQYMRSMRNG